MLDATFRPILKMNVRQVFKGLLNFLRVAGEEFLENFLYVLVDSYYLFKLKFNNNVANIRLLQILNIGSTVRKYVSTAGMTMTYS